MEPASSHRSREPQKVKKLKPGDLIIYNKNTYYDESLDWQAYFIGQAGIITHITYPDLPDNHILKQYLILICGTNIVADFDEIELVP
jgi:hypothetical protein